jgi:hypothetical protein
MPCPPGKLTAVLSGAIADAFATLNRVEVVSSTRAVHRAAIATAIAPSILLILITYSCNV